MARIFSKFLRQFWIVLVVALFGLLSLHTSNPIYGAPNATPTPDVQTVPKPIEILPPTNTPFPTPTTSDDSSSPDDGSVATPQPDDEDDNNNNSNNNDNNNSGSGNNNSGNNNSGNNGSSTSGTTANNNSASESSAATTGLIGHVNVVTLNVRKGPSADEHIIDKLFLDDQVEVLGRDGAGLWWYVCCGSGTQRAGWVNIEFITPRFAGADAPALLPVLANESATAPEQAGATEGAATAPPALLLEMRPLPAFAWQGQTVQLHFVVHNQSDQALSNIRLRDDLPPELAFVSATVDNGGTYNYRGAVESGPMLTLEWPTLPAQQKFTATVTLKIRTDTASGALIDNLAEVANDKGEKALAGLTLAMPPLRLPTFR